MPNLTVEHDVGVNLDSRSLVPVSVVILTKNEQENILPCIDFLKTFSDDVAVLDSGSTDGTAELAASQGVTVYQNPFTGFGDQRNWAIDNIRHRYDWVLHLDADERPTSAFVEEIRQVVESDPSEAGFYVPSKLMLGDGWLRYSSGYPVYQVRLFHRDRLRFANQGHGQREITDGKLGYLKEPYLHYAFSKGIEAWLAKHVHYAVQEAEAFLSDANDVGLASVLSQVLSIDRVRRRRALKRLSYALPGRPILRMLDMLVLKRGILDGKPGIAYAKMLAAYESMFVAYMGVRKATSE